VSAHGHIPDEQVERARGRDILEVARSLGFKLRQAGTSEWIGPCLVCDADDDGFSVNTAKQVWNCRKCKNKNKDASGDVIGLVRHKLKLDFPGAIVELTGDNGADRPAGGKSKVIPIIRSTSPEDDAKPKTPFAPLSLAEYREAKMLPLEHLKRHFVCQTGDYLAFHYFDQDRQRILRYHLRRGPLERKDRRFFWSKGPGEIGIYGAWKLKAWREQALSDLLLVEGESDALTAWHHGLACLGIPGKSLGKTLLAAHLEGFRRVFVVQEADDGGKDFARDMVERVKAFQTAGNFTGDGFIIDMEQAGEGIKDLSALHIHNPSAFRTALEKLREEAPNFFILAEPDLIEAAISAATLPATIPEGQLPQPNRPKTDFVISNWSQRGLPPPRQWFYGRHYIRDSLSSTIADGGVGKTTLALTEAIVMATGRTLLGIPPIGRYRVLYWNGEEPLAEIERRINAICRHFDVDLAELDGWLFCYSGLQHPIDAFAIDGLIELSEIIDHHQIQVASLDPFVDCHRAPENDNGQLNFVAKRFAALADEKKISIEISHHVRKPAHGIVANFTIHDSRGATALIDAARTARVLNRMTQAEADLARVENREGFVRIEDGKANYAAHGKAQWLSITEEILPNFDGTFGPDSVGVVSAWHFPGAFDGVAPIHMDEVVERAASGRYRASRQAEGGNWIGSAVADVLHLDPLKDAKRIETILAEWMRRGALKRVQLYDAASRKLRPFIVPPDFKPEDSADDIAGSSIKPRSCPLGCNSSTGCKAPDNCREGSRADESE
jgi:hypothetical protein